MNKYQRRRHKEIRLLMKRFNENNLYHNIKKNYGSVTIQEVSYLRARRYWNLLRRINTWGSPCGDCDNSQCRGPYNAIVLCPNNR